MLFLNKMFKELSTILYDAEGSLILNKHLIKEIKKLIHNFDTWNIVTYTVAKYFTHCFEIDIWRSKGIVFFD